jgi:hypothetical protein
MATVTRISARGGLSAPLLAVLLALAQCSAPTPAAAATPVPGAIVGHPFSYADSWTGWPVAPVHEQHPVRGSFLDPRAGYHFGIDIGVDDSKPERGAPPGRTHRVYALEGGVVAHVKALPRHHCLARRVSVGHFAYWHVDPVVRPGQRVRAGQLIGWTCKQAWHVHLSEWARIDGRRVWVNPLHRRGKLKPYRDSAAPVVHEMGFFRSGTALPPDHLGGVIDVRARISDPQSFRGWMVDSLEPLYADHHPYSVTLRIVRVADGRSWRRGVFRADAFLDVSVPSLGTPIPFEHHYAPTSRQNLPANACLRRQPVDCAGLYWLRLFASRHGFAWDTRAFRNGRYQLTVTVVDLRGNRVSATTEVAILN